jgi:NAD(P)-dependent dehydrogenase (short-subunit alcohol dehydrogenase family)
LGLGVCQALLEKGAKVTATWVVEQEAELARLRLGDALDLRELDATSAEALEDFAAELATDSEPWGVVQIVGGYRDGDPVAGMDMRGWDQQMALNLTPTALAFRSFLGGMAARGGGRAIAVSSRAALHPFAGASAYAASKAGVIALVQAASEEVKHDGVCVNCVLPSVIDTPANRRAQPDADSSRWVKPEEIGNVIAFLMSLESSAITGAAIPVYGRA